MVTELYKLSLNTFPEDCGEFAKEDSILRKTFKSNKNHRHGTSHISRSMGWARTGAASIIDTFAEMVLHHKRLSVSPERAVVVAALDNKLSIEVLAQRLWKSLAQAGADDVYEEDIARLFGHDRREEAEALFLKLDCNRNAAVSLQEMIGMLDDMARERGSMSKTMTDVKSSIDTFSAILAVAGLVGIALIYAAFFTENFARNFMAVTTAVLSLSFAFASTVQEFAASFLFLFVQHPFDVGDRCQVGNEEELIVEKICLLHTVFRDVKDNRLLQIPNRISSTLKIKNISRSRAMKERINIMVNANTTADDIKSLQIGLSDFVSSPAARRDYRPGVTVDITAIDDFASLNLIIVYGHKVSLWSMLAKSKLNIQV